MKGRASRPRRQAELAGNSHTDVYAKLVCLHDHLPNPEVYVELRAQSRARPEVSTPLSSLKAAPLSVAPTAGPGGQRTHSGTGDG